MTGLSKYFISADHTVEKYALSQSYNEEEEEVNALTKILDTTLQEIF